VGSSQRASECIGAHEVTEVAVLGAGAIGGSTAADLIEGSLKVVIINQWPAHVDAMRRDGLVVMHPDREQRVEVEAFHLCDLNSLSRRFDIVLLGVKAYDTRWSCELIKPHLRQDGVIVALQNAMTMADIVDIVGPPRTLGCIIEMAAEVFTPGTREATHSAGKNVVRSRRC
jgi:2-dehydropantoate 2-reductase